MRGKGILYRESAQERAAAEADSLSEQGLIIRVQRGHRVRIRTNA
jgi:hypothetical protein